MSASYKNYWAYKDIKDAGYYIKVLRKSVTISTSRDFSEPWAKFEIRNIGEDGYAVYLDNENLEDCFDYPSDTWDQAVQNACYYFETRF